MGQAHAGVEGAWDVEPEQRPLLLRNPLSGPCQKQRFCSPGNIPPCLSHICTSQDTSVTKVHLMSVFLMELFHLHFHIYFTKFLIQRSWLQTPSESYIINHRCLQIQMGFDSPFEHCEMRNGYKILLGERCIEKKVKKTNKCQFYVCMCSQKC